MGTEFESVRIDGGAMVQATYPTALEGEPASFSPLPQPSFIARLVRAIREGFREFIRNPLTYLRRAFFPEKFSDWLPLRVLSALGSLGRHPLIALGELFRRDRIPVGMVYEPAEHTATFVTNAVTITRFRSRAWDRFAAVLIGSLALHGVLIGVLGYLTIMNMLAPYAHIRIVNAAYRPFSSGVVAELYARSRPLAHPGGPVLSLEELRERERLRREAIERNKAEAEAREKAAREKAEREAKEAEEKAKAEEAAKKPGSIGDIAINETAIKDMVSKMYDRYKKGELDAGTYSVLVAFRIDCDGSMPRSSIRVLKSSPKDPKKEDLALQILWLIGESHAMGPLCQFSSNTIGFEMNDDMTRLSISGFGPTPEWTNQKALELRTLFLGLAMLRRGTDPGELAKLVKISTTAKRLDLDLTLSRARASEMMRNKFSGASQ